MLPTTGSAYADGASPSPTPSVVAPEDDSTLQTAPPPAPTESGLVDVTDPNAEPTPTATQDPGMNHPGSQYCEEYGGKYRPTSKNGKYMRAVGPTQHNYNNTSRDMPMTFTATASGTVGVTLSASGETSVSAMVAAQKVTYGMSLSTSLTATLSNSVNPTAPPHTTISASYGVWREKITGVTYRLYSNCQQSPYRTIVSYTPWYVGWYVWQG
ncbi:hypothetical protein [Streptomyces sp. NPDC014006]|uniref:hypothetical protein n=1 Tax=Streptomyces sp. NPDC014006 TaxID=3364870 RepID=UPI0037016A16